MGIGQRIHAAMLAAGKNPTDIARHLGITDSAVHQWFSKDSGPRGKRIASLASFLSVSPGFLVAGEDPPVNNSDQDSSDEHTIVTALPPLILWKSMLAPGPGATWMLKKEKVGEVERPYKMRFSRKGFAVEVLDERNHPVYRRRDTLFINPEKPVLPEDDCLLTGNPEAPPGASSVVGLLVEAKQHEWIIRQYNVKGDQHYSRADFPNAWFVQGLIRH